MLIFEGKLVSCNLEISFVWVTVDWWYTADVVSDNWQQVSTMSPSATLIGRTSFYLKRFQNKAIRIISNQTFKVNHRYVKGGGIKVHIRSNNQKNDLKTCTFMSLQQKKQKARFFRRFWVDLRKNIFSISKIFLCPSPI